MGQIIRITLTHEIGGSFIMSEPEGWKEAVIGFERHPEFHCVVPFYKSSFSAYGSNGINDGLRDKIKEWEQTYGPDAIVSSLVESSYNGGITYTEIFTGQLPIQAIVEMCAFDHTLQITFDARNFWTKFLSRFDTPVNLYDTVSLDGVTVEAAPVYGIQLPAQYVRQETLLNQTRAWDFGYNGYLTSPDFNKELHEYDQEEDRYYLSFDLDYEKISEIEVKGTPTLGETEKMPDPLFIPRYGGTYQIEIELYFTTKRYSGSANPGFYKTQNLAYGAFGFIGDDPEGNSDRLTSYLKIGSGVEIPLSIQVLHSSNPDHSYDPVNTPADSVPNGYDYYVKHTYSGTVTLNAGDVIRLYAKNNFENFGAGNNTASISVNQIVLLGKSNADIEWPYSPLGGALTCYITDSESFIHIIADTLSDDTRPDGFLTHDVANAITNKITSQNDSFYSEYVGRNDVGMRTYESIGCGGNLVNISGLLLRGYTIAEKPVFMSMRDWWEGINPIHNLGLRHTVIDDVDVIQVEEVASFFDDSTVSTQLSNVRNIRKTYDKEWYFNQIEVGYGKWESEEISGIDDPQTKRIFASIFKNIGVKLTLLSKWITAGLTIQNTIRKSIVKSQDYKYDNDIFAIEVFNNSVFFEADVDNYTDVTNLRSPETRYNKGLTPVRNIIRWLNYISGGLQSYTSSVLKFVKGEGNYEMTSTKADAGCSYGFTGSVAENQDLPVSEDYLFLPIEYEIEHYLTSDQFMAIKNAPEASIEVSQTESNYVKFFIKSAQYNPHTGAFLLTAWPKTYFNIQSVPTVTGEVDPYTRIFDSTFGPPFS